MKGLPAGAVQSEDPLNAIHGTSSFGRPLTTESDSILVERMKEALPHWKEKFHGVETVEKLSRRYRAATVPAAL